MAQLDEETQARVRAAIAYTGKNWDEFADELGISRQTLGRRLKRDVPPVQHREFLATLAAAAGLPLGFFYGDFATLDEDAPADSARLISAQLSELAAAQRELAATVIESLVDAGLRERQSRPHEPRHRSDEGETQEGAE